MEADSNSIVELHKVYDSINKNDQVCGIGLVRNDVRIHKMHSRSRSKAQYIDEMEIWIPLDESHRKSASSLRSKSILRRSRNHL